MTVTSQDIPKVAAPASLRATPMRGVFDGALPSTWAVSAVLFVFGLMGWIAGGRYTADGWIIWANLFSAWLGVPLHIPPLAGRGLWMILPVGLIYSRVEVSHRPAWRDGAGRWHGAPLIYWVAWGMIVATDVGTTYVGVTHPAPAAWLIVQQIATTPALAVGWAITLTFMPEWFMIKAQQLWHK